MKGLREDDAVIGIRRQRVWFRKVSEERGARVRAVDVDDADRNGATRAEHRRVRVVLDLEYRSAYCVAMLVQEDLNVPAVERRTAIESIAVAQRLKRDSERLSHDDSLAGVIPR